MPLPSDAIIWAEPDTDHTAGIILSVILHVHAGL